MNDRLIRMGAIMDGAAPLDPYQVRVIRLGAAIREHRLAKGWKQAELGTAVALSHTAISHFEKGSHVPRRDVTRRIDDVLGARGRIWTLRDELDDDPGAKWNQRLLRYESRAVRIRQAGGVIPALLQNPEYERAIIEKNNPFFGGDVEDKLKYRARRHAILKRPDPPQFSALISEAALYSLIGSRSIMRNQLTDLIASSQEPGIEVRIAPFEGNADLLQVFGGFTIMDLPGGKTVVYAASGLRGLLIAKPEEVAGYIGIYDQLQARALDVEASRVLIRKVVREMYGA
ncbi:helix-turn-helix domain-containing protein [Streptomyces huiliensis]|uniref:helix-turn-helix domain-containing protein n=1 Tax=Streptomyces huiliensis TaxID=2876027 RepID=UPI001CBBDF88|nr:helix-turn-helix transcriptional regulator [Streptomyces huiliensis]MBZ4322936.1 helix-turn-helix domain-containing protein [Streptomyces huiliensis]